ncbi:MAG: hypothetical protein V8R81_06510 [Clostridia bacterium]
MASKFCTKIDRGKIIEPISEPYPQVIVTTRFKGFASYYSKNKRD